LFIGRFWGFRPERVPFITFSRAIHRNALLRASEPGDRIVVVASKREDPAADDRGHILGMAEIGRTPVDTLEVVKPGDIPAREWAGAEPRCPKALPMLQAWRFTGAPPVPPQINWKLPRAAAGAVEGLRAGAAALILSLPHEKVILRDSLDASPRAGSAPAGKKRSLSADARAEPGLFLVFRFGQRNAWKFGNSYEPHRMLEELNRHIPGALLDEKWEIVFSAAVPSAAQAHELEQDLRNALAPHHAAGDLFVCDARTVELVWSRVAARKDQSRSGA
jgi:hypothetical protein